MPTIAGRPFHKRTVAGRGALRAINGFNEPRGRRPLVPPVLLDPGTSGTYWAVSSGVTETTGAITNPDGISRTLVRFPGTAANTTAFIDWVPGGTLTIPPWAQGIEFDVYVTGSDFATKAANGYELTVQVRNSAGTQVLQAVTLMLSQQWQRVRINKADFSVLAGTPVWGDSTAFDRIRVRLQGYASHTHDIYCGPLSWAGVDRAKICVAFDDIGISVYNTAFPIMRARGIPGSNSVISDAIGQSAWNGYDRCSVAQLLEMNRAGWDCISHTKSHQSGVLPTALQSACAVEIETPRDAIISNGLGNGISEYLLAAPYGEFGTNYWAAADAAGVKLFRGTYMVNASNIVPVGDTFLGMTRSVPCLSVLNTSSTANVLAAVDSVARTGGSLILLFHHVVTTPGTSIEYSTANFTTVMDGLVDASRRMNFDLVNMTQMYLQSRL